MTATEAPLGEEETLRRRRGVRAFLDAEIVPRAGEFDRDEYIPATVLRQVAEQGWWGAVVPSRSGGAGMDMAGLGLLHEEVGRACSSLRSLLTVHSMVAHALVRWGSDAQRERWLPRLAAGGALGAFCLTEPEAGSDAAAIATAATDDGDGFVLDGRKRWITGGQVAELLLVFARTGEGISAFAVERETPGVTVTPIHDLLGTRGSMLAEITLDSCHVGPDALVGPRGFGLGTVLTGTLDLGRYSVAAGCVGIIQACLEASAGYSEQRSHRSVPLKDQQLVRQMLADMVTNARAGRLLYQEAGRLKDRGDPATIMATWVAKYFASTAAVRAAADAVQIHGAIGCSDSHPVARYYRDAKIMEIIEGSTQIQQLAIAGEAHRGGLR